MKKAVVVGGSGFIGSHVADHLSEAGYQVTIYDKTESQWLRDDQKFVVGDVQDDKKILATKENKDSQIKILFCSNCGKKYLNKKNHKRHELDCRGYIA